MTDQPQPASTPVPTTDPLASDAVTVENKLIGYGEGVAESAIIAAVPAMGTPVLKQIWEKALDALISMVFQPLLNAFTGKIIVNAQEYFRLKNAVAQQLALDQAVQSGDLNAEAQAQATLDAAVAQAAQYIGAVKPTA